MQLVVNFNNPLVDPKTGKILRPWNFFFQSFTQKPPQVQPVLLSASPFEYTPNEIGTVFINGGTVSSILFIRGPDIITVNPVNIILIGIGDTIRVTYTVAPTMKFAPLF